jgi:hypothetical protein
MSNTSPTPALPKFVMEDNLMTEEQMPYLDGNCTVIVHHRNEPTFMVNAGDKIDLANDYTRVVAFNIGTYTEGDCVSAVNALGHIYFRTNHIDSDWTQEESIVDMAGNCFSQMLNPVANSRSTSVGDVYEIVWTSTDWEGNIEAEVSDFYIVNGCGWKEVSGFGDQVW